MRIILFFICFGIFAVELSPNSDMKARRPSRGRSLSRRGGKSGRKRSKEEIEIFQSREPVAVTGVRGSAWLFLMTPFGLMRRKDAII